MTLPGDDLIAAPILQRTLAVTISAPPQEVWPWLVQIGQDRAGFYSDSRMWDRMVDRYYRLLSRGQIGYRVREADRVVPHWQHPRNGDIIADGPPGTAYFEVRQVEPGRSFVLFTDSHLRYLLPRRLRDDPRLGIWGDISYGYSLREPQPGTTRLVRRMRLTCGPRLFAFCAVPVVLGWGEAITARRLLRGLKRRAVRGQSQLY